MDALFAAVREQCSRGVWSRGVELARSGAVLGQRAAGDEIELRVSTRGGLISPCVVLHPGDEDWDCDCRSADDPCEHVAAAVIALRRARREGRDLPEPARAAGRLRYLLSRAPGGLALEREVVGPDGATRPLTTTLAAVASGRVEGPAVAATADDLAVERALGPRLRGVLPPGVLVRLFSVLSERCDVRLDGEPVKLAAEPLRPRAVLADRGDDFALTLDRHPGATEIVAEGVALCGDTLRPIGESGLSGRELAELPRGQLFPPGDAAVLVTEVLPSLRGRIEVDVRTQRLPRTSAEPPRLSVETRRAQDRLSVLATLVYGDPPAARVDAGRLVHLRGSVPLRDLAAERRLERRLANELGLAPGHRLELAGEEAVDFAERLAAWRGGVVRGRAHEDFFRTDLVEPRLAVSGDRFELAFEVPDAPDDTATRRPGAGRRAGAEAVLHAFRAGESLVPLAGGGFAPLPSDWLARHGARVADLLAAREPGGRLPACALPDLARLCDEIGEARPPGADRLERLLAGFEGLPDAPDPADLRASLRGYQRRGIAWLCFLRDAGLGGVLADDMGLGKTLQALCALRGRALVVTPTSVVRNWADEIERFRPGLRCALYHGPRRELDPGADVVLTTYAILRLDAARLARERWAAVVLDEAQAIKNPESQVARAARALSAPFRIALTGTPVENRLDELWSQLHFANPGLLGTRRDFDERYARPIAAGDDAAAERLRERVRPFVLRRRKREVAPELPPRIELLLRCELDDAERAVYDAVRAATRADVVRRLAAGDGVLAALEALLRLRQAACHAGLVPGQEAASSSKLELLLETLDEVVAEGHKALVFSQWTSLLDRVEPALGAAGIAATRLDGATRDRAGVVARFQDEAGPPVMLISLRAGGTGLNLTAADHVFLLDPWWNPAVEDQAADRAHRIGQTKPVAIYRLVAQDTVEERILELQARKREVADVALGGAGAAAALTRDDLLALLE